MYIGYSVASSFLPWLAVFTLFFLERVSLAEAIKLGAIYYIAVVIFEVPSGYFSDRCGRKPTLLLASCLTIASYLIFLSASDFTWLLVANCFLAAGIAFRSGTDSSLLYDSLKQLDRTDEYGQREAEAQKYGLIALAISCLVGGFVGLWDLKIAYGIGLIAALASLLICFRFIEPSTTDNKRAGDFWQQLRECFSYLRDKTLAWIMGVYVLGYALQHVPYEFFQPYIQILENQHRLLWFANGSTPLVSGIVIALSMFGGAIGAAVSMKIYKKLGLANTLLLGLTLVGIIIAGMAWFLHPAVLLLLMLRNFPMSMVHAPMLAAISPRIDSAHRATYLSIQSLLGRLAFSSMLYLLALLGGQDAAIDWDVLSTLMLVSGIVAVLGIAVLAILSRAFKV